jgi:hypothetical protein
MSRSEIAALGSRIRQWWEEFSARPAAPDDPNWVRRFLEIMYDADQAYRDLYVAFVDGGDEASRQALAPLVMAADAEHRARLGDWLAGRGWPRRSVYGADPCTHAWMIALHADKDVAFQARAYRAMTELLREGEVDPVQYAALHDRIALNQGRAQRYGMFFHVEDGREVAYPVEAPEGLSLRRAELGLGDARFRR